MFLLLLLVASVLLIVVSTSRYRFHPFLALIATATDRELAEYLDYLKEENKILRARLPGTQVHTTPA